MLVLPTAKILLYIGLTLGPHHPPVIYATSNSEAYVWRTSQAGWEVEGKGFPASDITRDPTKVVDFSGSPSSRSVPSYLRGISHLDWKHDAEVVFDNGDRVEKHGDHAFYIINAGGPNEKIFTICYPTCD